MIVMMKKCVFSILTGLALIGPYTEVSAQAFAVGDNVIGLSVGVGGHYRAYNSYTAQTPAIGLQYEHALTELGPGVLGLGGLVGYKTLAYRSRAGWPPGHANSFYEYDYRWSYLMIGVRGAWHYNEWHGIPELDVYGGLMIAYNSVTYRDRTPYPAGVYSTYHYGGGNVGASIFLGTRYFLTPNVGAQLELGYGISVISLGVVFKF